MKDSKIYYFLSKLSSGEQKQFAAFVKSPFFNAKEDLSTLLRVIEKPKNPPSEEKAWELIFPGKPFDKNRLRKMKTALLKLFFQFIEVSDFLQDESNRTARRLKRLNLMRENQYFASYAKGEEATGNHFSSLEIALEHYRYDARQSARYPNGALNHALEHLETGYREQKLRLAYLSENQHNIAANGKKVEGIKDLLLKIKQDWEDIPDSTKVYFWLFKGVSQKEPRFFEKLIHHLRQCSDQLAEETLKEGQTGALNFCARQINRGNNDFLPVLFQQYTAMLEGGLLTEKGKLQAPHFKNMISVAATLGKLDWAMAFWEEYRGKLFGDYEGNVEEYSRGVIHFHSQEYEQAERCFNSILASFEDVFLGLDSRIFLLKIFYETADLLRMEALCDSSRMYLTRNPKLTPDRKANYKLFIRYIRRLTHIAEHEPQKLHKLREEMISGDQLSSIPWLLEKLDLKLKTTS